MTKDDFFTREHAEGLTAADFRFIQTEILDMTNDGLAAALGFKSREAGRRYVLNMRKGRNRVTASVGTALWFLAFSGERPAWAPENMQ